VTTVRPAVPGDVDALREITVRGWEAAYGHIFSAGFIKDLRSPTRAETRRRMWLERLRAPAASRVFCLVAEHDGAVVGWVHAGPAERGSTDTGEVYGIYVDPEAWGSGAGTTMLERATEQLIARGSTTVQLWTLELNQRARAFYARHGWVHDGGRRVRDFGGEKAAEVRYVLGAGREAAVTS